MQYDETKHEETEQAEQVAEHVEGEPPVEALSNEALESVAGGCQVDISAATPWEQLINKLLLPPVLPG